MAEKGKKTTKKKEISEKIAKKETKKDVSKKTNISKSDMDQLKKDIIKEKTQQLTKLANDVAERAMMELQLQTQVQLSDKQKEAVKLLGAGYSNSETANKLGVCYETIMDWHKIVPFMAAVTDATHREGLSDRGNRIKASKRIAQSITDAMIDKIVNGDLDGMRIQELSELALKWSTRLDALVDKKEDINNKDLTVLILNHVQENSKKKYNKIEDFLEDDAFKYPVIDIDSEDVTEKPNE